MRAPRTQAPHTPTAAAARTLLVAAAAAGALGRLLAGVDVGAQVADGRARVDGGVDGRLGVQAVWQDAAQVEDTPVLARQRGAAVI